MGTIFIGAHQLLIMMQIKMSQQVLIKIPASMDLFAQNVQKDAVFKSVRNTLVKQLLIEKTKTTMAGEKNEELDKKIKDFRQADVDGTDMFRI